MINFLQYKSDIEAISAMTDDILTLSQIKQDCSFNIALSGGNTAKIMFEVWAKNYKYRVEWSKFNFYWVDERMVDQLDVESNYLYANELFFKPMLIPNSNIFRIAGEYNPKSEAAYYSELVRHNIPNIIFDAIILGIGDDLHIASIFSNNMDLLKDNRVYALSEHPVTRQLRVTMTGTTILSGAPIFIPIIGESKQPVIDSLLSMDTNTPASYIFNKARSEFKCYIIDQMS